MASRRKIKLSPPLNKKDVSVLLLLEEDAAKNNKDKSLTKKLISEYSKLIEYYDFQKDPIKHYFIDKMQSIIHKANSIASINPVNNYMSKLKNKFDSLGKSLKTVDTNKPAKKAESKKTDPQNIEKLMEIRKSKRNHEIFFADKFQSLQRKTKGTLKKDLEKFREKSEINNETVTRQLSSQDVSIHEKLLKRKQRSISRSMQRTLGSFVKDKSNERRATQLNNRDDGNFLVNLYKDDNPYG